MNEQVERLLYVLASVAALVFAGVAVFLAYHTANEDHAVLCGQKRYLAGQIHDSHVFLNETRAERVAKYGSIGDIPDNVIRSSLAKQVASLHNYDSLSCS